MIKAVNGRFDYYSISPKIRQFFDFEVMNQLKVIRYNLFLFMYKLVIIF